MIWALLAEAVQPETQPDVTRLVLEYLFYAAIIVVGILLLIVLRRKTRLPRHGELRKQLAELSAQLEELRAAAEGAGMPRMKFLKGMSKLVYRTDKLIYVTDCMADKERDGEIANISALLSQARTELAAYKFGTRTVQDAGGMRLAAGKLAEAEELLERVLARDIQLQAGTKKQ